LELLRHFGRDKSGAYIVVAALAMPILVGAAGLGTEVGSWMHQKQRMQDAADSAAFAAATYYGPNPASSLSNQATSVTAAYGFTPAMNGTGSVINVSQPPTDGPSKGVTGAVEVTINRSYPRMLSALFAQTPVTIRARAVAKTKGGYGCVLALDPGASASVSAQGTVNIAANNCSIYDDSSSLTAVSGGGGAAVSALSVGIVGSIANTSNYTTVEGIWTKQPSTPDPYNNVNVPSFSGCYQNNFNSNKKNQKIIAGVYCNGMTFNAGNAVTLDDGTYIIDRGTLKVNGGAEVDCAHCTFVLTSSTGKNYATVDVDGGAIMNVGPPNSGTMSGVIIYADRNTPVGTAYTFNGGSSQGIGGAVYIPTGAITWSGGNTAGAVCTQLIGDTVSFDGNAGLGVNCAGMGVKMWGTGAVLAE
jgi:Flp pilus assembly protein TadG